MAVSTIKDRNLVMGDYAESASVSVSNRGTTSTTINMAKSGYKLIGLSRLQTSANSSVGVVGYNINPATDVLTVYLCGLITGSASAKAVARGVYIRE